MVVVVTGQRVSLDRKITPQIKGRSAGHFGDNRVERPINNNGTASANPAGTGGSCSRQNAGFIRCGYRNIPSPNRRVVNPCGCGIRQCGISAGINVIDCIGRDRLRLASRQEL